MKTAEEKLVLLDDTIKYYSGHSRCIQNIGGKINCRYSGTTAGLETEGCAIGRLLEPELRLELDSGAVKGVGVDIIWNRLPQEIQAYGKDFLIALQSLHDNSYYWNGQDLVSTGLSSQGREQYGIIKRQYCKN